MWRKCQEHLSCSSPLANPAYHAALHSGTAAASGAARRLVVFYSLIPKHTTPHTLTKQCDEDDYNLDHSTSWLSAIYKQSFERLPPIDWHWRCHRGRAAKRASTAVDFPDSLTLRSAANALSAF